MTVTSTCNTFYSESTFMDSSEVFKKIAQGHEVYLQDKQENCVMKCYNDKGIVGVMFKKKGGKAYRVDVKNAEIYDIMQESTEVKKEVYDEF